MDGILKMIQKSPNSKFRVSVTGKKHKILRSAAGFF
jgi:hypothetical protein